MDINLIIHIASLNARKKHVSGFTYVSYEVSKVIKVCADSEKIYVFSATRFVVVIFDRRFRQTENPPKTHGTRFMLCSNSIN